MNIITCIIHRNIIQIGIFILKDAQYTFRLANEFNNDFCNEGRLFNSRGLARVMAPYTCCTLLIALEGNQLYEQIDKKEYKDNKHYIVSTFKHGDHYYSFGYPWSLLLQYSLWAFEHNYKLLLCTTLSSVYAELCLNAGGIPNTLTTLVQSALAQRYYDINKNKIPPSHFGLYRCFQQSGHYAV